MGNCGIRYVSIGGESVTTPKTDWYTVNSNTVRFYKLNDTTDYGPSGATLTNSAVTFTTDYAIFNGTSAYFKDTTYKFKFVNETFFFWFNPVNYTPAGNSKCVFAYGETGPNNIGGGTQWYNSTIHPFYQWSSGGYISATARALSFSTWGYYCFVKNGANLKTYSGSTSTIYEMTSDAVTTITATMLELTIGARSQYHDRFYKGNINGFIVESVAWNTSQISAQAAKGAYNSTTYL